MEERVTTMMEDQVSSSPHLDVERENPEESLDLLDLEDPLELVERSLDEPPAKMRSSWC